MRMVDCGLYSTLFLSELREQKSFAFISRAPHIVCYRGPGSPADLYAIRSSVMLTHTNIGWPEETLGHFYCYGCHGFATSRGLAPC